MRIKSFIAALAAALALSACSSLSRAIPGNGNAASSRQVALGSKITHVIVVVLENRSFDNIFADDAALKNVTDPPVDVDSSFTATSKGKPTTLLPDTLTASSFDEDHSHQGFLADYDGGKNDGWSTGTDGAYGYVPATEVQPYYDIAAQSAISDRFFHGITAPTFPSHVEIGAATTFGIIDNPSSNTWGCDAPPGTTTGLYDPSAPGQEDPTGGPFPCFDDLSIFDLLDRGGVSWRYYVDPEGDDITGNLNIAGYFRHIRYGADWNDDIATTDAEVLTDLASGTLRQVSFVIPDDASTDHAGEPSLGPTYVEALVNAFGKSQYYDNTLMIITWDDWGGWYDHVVPPQRADGSQLSFRKPVMLVGGYVKHNYCSHVQTEDASIAKTLEEVFGLGSLGTHDVAAAGFDDALDLSQTPPAFKTIVSVQGTYVPTDRRRSSYFRVVPASYMHLGPNGRFPTMSRDFYGRRAVDY